MKRGYVDTPHGQIHYRTAGDGPPVIIFHMTPASSEAMQPLIQAFADAGFTAIGMDTMGYGESDRPPHPYTTMEEFAQTVAWFIQGLGYEKVHLFGDQTGSQIAMQTAADFPELVESIAVFDPFNWGTPSRRAVHERLHRYHPRNIDGSHIKELWERCYRGGRSIKQAEVALRNYLKVNDDTGAEVYGAMGWEGAGPYAMTRQDIWSVTPRITSPMYVTYATDSELHRALEKFLETLPRAKGNREFPSPRRTPKEAAALYGEFFRNPGI